MEKFSQLLNQLYFTHSNLSKHALLQTYFAEVPDPIRGFALGIIAGTLSFKFFKRGLVQGLIKEKFDPFLFDLSYDYVGDLSDTVALLWPSTTVGTHELPLLNEVIARFENNTKQQLKDYLQSLLDNFTSDQRWALLKLGTSSLRVGVSARFIKQALADYGSKTIHEIEEVWHATEPPYENLFAWLENKAPKPELGHKIFFHPVMLSHPLDDDDLVKISPNNFFAEWKYDGIRVQLVGTKSESGLFSRTGDDIHVAFSDLLLDFDYQIVLDGELVIQRDGVIASFNDLQQRLNKKNPSKKLMQESPAHVIVYDILSLEGEDLRGLTLQERRTILENWFTKNQPKNLSLSQILNFHNVDDLKNFREQVVQNPHPAIEGLMLKRKASAYISGRPSGQWYKWKRDPFLVDAVLMYAQRGHGKRSSFYSDYTYGLWQDDVLLPIGKAYFGFTDEELKQIDKWVRLHTTNKFGPVREVAKELVFEVAFDSVQKSARHKSGFALRFPRINRIRWDKPAKEADQLSALEMLLHQKKEDLNDEK